MLRTSATSGQCPLLSHASHVCGVRFVLRPRGNPISYNPTYKSESGRNSRPDSFLLYLARRIGAEVDEKS